MFPPLPHVMNFTKRAASFGSAFRAFVSGLQRTPAFALPFGLRRVGSADRLHFGDSAFIERLRPSLRGALPPQSAPVLPLRSIQAKSALLLLVTRILADDHNATLALNDLALLAHRFY